MAWRKWIVRGVVSIVAGCCAAGGYVYQQWTNPAAVREQVLAKMQTLFPGAEVAVDSARLTLMGRIQVGPARLSRRDDPDGTDAVQIPSAYLYHDKEKLLEGELSIRKVELFRPRFRAYRGKDGTWNLQGLIGKQRLDRPIPTLVIHQGTLLLEDRATAGNISSLEITEFNATSINDPLPTLAFEGMAQAPLVGKVTVVGTLQRATGELTLSIATKDTPLSSKLLQRISPFCPKNSLQDVDVNGQADFRIELNSRPNRTPSLRYDVWCDLRKTRVKHPALPMELEDVDARIGIADGELTLERGQARVGGARVKARGTGQLPCVNENFEAFVEIDGLPISETVVGCLPEKTRDVVHQFRPRGEVAVRLSLLKREGQWARFEDGREPAIAVLPSGIASVFEKFPYPIEDVSGTIDYQLISKKTKFHVEAKASGQPVRIRGHAAGSGADLDLAAEIQASNLPIDETALKALPPGPEKIARSFRASGRFDAMASIRHKPGTKAFDNAFRLTFRDCTAAWEAFPLPLANVSGQLDIASSSWEFRDFRGEHDGGAFRIKGRSYAIEGKEQPGVLVEIVGSNAALTPTMSRALEPMPTLKKVWTTFRPSGRMNFAAVIHRPTADVNDLDVRIQARGLTLEPRFFEYRFDDVQGVVHYKNERIELANLSARHGETAISAGTGRVELRRTGGFHADIPEVDVRELRADADLIKALPESLAKACATMQLRDSVRAKARIVVAQSADPDSRPEIYWNAQGWIKDASLVAGTPIDGVTGVIACRGRHDGRKIAGLEGNVLIDRAVAFKQPLQNIHAHFHIDEAAPDVLLAGATATQHGGALTAEIRVDFQPTIRFDLNATAAQIDLQKFGQHNLGAASQLEGRAAGRLHLTGTDAGVASLDGNGSIDVLAAKLYNLPLILDLLKFLGLRWPDRTAFEEVHALFRIRGPRVALRKLELQGNAVSLTGTGEFNLDGSDLNVDFYPTWGRIEQVLPPALRSVPPAVSKNFLIIEMRGKVSSNPADLKFNKRPMPILFDPLNNVREFVIGASEDRRIDDRRPAGKK